MPGQKHRGAWREIERQRVEKRNEVYEWYAVQKENLQQEYERKLFEVDEWAKQEKKKCQST